MEMHYTKKWISIVTYCDEEGELIKIQTNSQLKKYKILKTYKKVNYEKNMVEYIKILQKKPEQLKLF